MPGSEVVREERSQLVEEDLREDVERFNAKVKLKPGEIGVTRQLKLLARQLLWRRYDAAPAVHPCLADRLVPLICPQVLIVRRLVIAGDDLEVANEVRELLAIRDEDIPGA